MYVLIFRMTRPQLRGLLRRQTIRDVAYGSVFSFGIAAAYWFGFAVPRRKVYEDYYNTFNPDGTLKVKNQD